MLRTARFRILLTAVALAGSSLALTSDDAPATALETETLFIAAGCPTDATGSCTSIRWLGTEPGDATSNYRNSTLPVDEVRYRVDGSLNWRDYWGDETVGTYELSGDEITVVVALASNGPGIQTTVHLRMAVRIGGNNVVFEPEPESVDMLPLSKERVEFTIDVAEYAGLELTDAVVELAVHGLNAQAGYIDQQGGSTVTIPHLVPVDTA